MARHTQSAPRLLATTLLLAASFVHATTYYVSPSGSDTNAGTISSPFATVGKAHSVVIAGDTIFLRGGLYTVSAEIVLNRSGNAGNRIQLWAYSNETPILDATSMVGEPKWIFRLTGASWWHIRGLELRNNPHGGGLFISNNSNNNIIENNNAHHNGAASEWAGTGIVLYGNPSNNLILNNDSHHNRDADCGDADGFDMGITGTGNIMRGNRAWANSDDGIDLFNTNDNTSGGEAVVENNWSWRNGYDSAGQPCGNGNGFKLGGQRAATTSTSGGHLVRRNVAWQNRAIGFDENASTKPNTLIHNTAWNNLGFNFGFWNSTNIFRNNLAMGTSGVQAAGDAGRNSWTLAVTVNNADFLSIDPTCAEGPRQADGELPNCPFLHLISSSDLIDKGVNVGLPYAGAAPDLGAFEFATVDAGSDAGVGAGHDAGTTDAGRDAGSSTDAGRDAGSSTDAGGGDAGLADGGDGGSDAGHADAGSDGGPRAEKSDAGTSGGDEDPLGCGCSTPGPGVLCGLLSCVWSLMRKRNGTRGYGS